MKPKKKITPKPSASKPETTKVTSSAHIQTSQSARKFVPLKSFDKAKKRLIERFGFKEDELAVSFKTEAELLKFYNEVARAEHSNKVEEAIGWDSEDAYDAPADEKDRLAANRKAIAKEKFEAVNPAVNAEAGKPAAPVSFDEFLRAGSDLDSLRSELEAVNLDDDITDHESSKK